MSAFNTKKHSQPKGMRMDKANGELEKGAEVGGAGGQSVGCCPTCGALRVVPSDAQQTSVMESSGAKSYRGVPIARSIHANYEESVWKRAVDQMLATGGWPVISPTRLLASICKRILCEGGEA